MRKEIEATEIEYDDPYGELLEMANLSPKRTGLKVNIWSEDRGITRNVKHNKPRVKITYQEDFSISVSIEAQPEVLSKSKSLNGKNKASQEWKALKDGIAYVGRNYDLFLKHYNDTDDTYDDDDLKDDLRARGEYK